MRQQKTIIVLSPEGRSKDIEFFPSFPGTRAKRYPRDIHLPILSRAPLDAKDSILEPTHTPLPSSQRMWQPPLPRHSVAHPNRTSLKRSRLRA